MNTRVFLFCTALLAAAPAFAAGFDSPINRVDNAARAAGIVAGTPQTKSEIQDKKTHDIAMALGGEKRVALVIGNAAYKNVPPLSNPPNDARLMAQTLTGLGFQLVGGKPLLDGDKQAIEKAIRAFGQALQGGAVGLFYYSGHGVQIKGTNYIIPVTATINNEADVKYELVDTNFVLDEMTTAGNRLNMMILDACRNNPFGGRGLRGVASGLAQMTAPAGTLISYSTAPNTQASDGAGKNSPFTAALASTLVTPGLNVFEAFNDVAVKVDESTHGQQQPWTSTSPIKGKFYFAGLPGNGAIATIPAPPPQQVATLTPVNPNVARRGRVGIQIDNMTPELARSLGISQSRGVPIIGVLPNSPGAVAGLMKNDVILEVNGEAVKNNVDVVSRISHLVPGAQLSLKILRERREQDVIVTVDELSPADAAFADVMSLYSNKDYERAFEGFLKFTDAFPDNPNVARVRTNLSSMYLNGLGVAKDEAEGVILLRSVADQGYAGAQSLLAIAYLTGRGVPKDNAQAAGLLRKAADQNDAMAQAYLGWMYEEGLSVTKDTSQAIALYRKAADKGDPSGEYYLGASYEKGLGVPKDISEARAWYHKAADQGQTDAIDALKRLGN